MATVAFILRLQQQINYRFNDVSLLETALTAPGVEGDKGGSKEERDKYDGNRKLALLGDSVLKIVILQKTLFEEGSELSFANDTLRLAALKERHEERAKFFEIDSHMKLSPRQEGPASTRTLSRAVCAIFAACFRDSGNLSVVQNVIDHFGLRTDPLDARRYVGPVPTPSDVTNGQLTTRIPSAGLESDLDTSSNASMIDMNFGVQSYEARDHYTYTMSSEGSATISGWAFSTAGLGEGSLSSYCDNRNLNGGTISGFLDREHEGYTHSDSASTSELLMSEYLMDIDSGNLSIISSTGGILASTRDVNGSLHGGSDETVSPNQPQMGNARRIPTQTASGPERRKKPSSSGDSIEDYVLLEKARCQAAGFPCPEEGFNSIIGYAATESLKIKDAVRELRVFFFAIASPESLAALKLIIDVQRRSPTGHLSMPNWDLPLAERIRAVETLSENVAYVGLIRRCHVHEIFLESSAGTRKTSDGWVNLTPQEVSIQSRPQIGNPRNLEDARISRMIMKLIYPTLEIGNPEYKTKLGPVKKIRKLGQRLDMLVEKFGYGILGLLPLVTGISAVEPILNITDSLIMSFQDDIFKWFVDCLDRLLGNLLREMSEATSEIVTAISRGTLDPTKRYGIEDLSHEYLRGSPRGSPVVLEALRSTYPA